MKIVMCKELLYRSEIFLYNQFSVKREKKGSYVSSSQLIRVSQALSRSSLYRGSKNGVESAARSPVECISPRATTKIRSSTFGSSSSLPCRAFVKSCEWTRVSRASRRGVVSECEQDQEKPEHVRATCRRRHARARTLATLDSLFPLLSFISPLSLSLFFAPFFFYTRDFAHTPSPVFTDRRNRRRVYFYSPRIAMSDRSDLFSFSVQYYATIENVRSVSRIRGKRCHVQGLPTSMMQLAFNPHSRIL